MVKRALRLLMYDFCFLSLLVPAGLTATYWVASKAQLLDRVRRGSTRPNVRKEANLVDVQEIRQALGKAGSKKEPEHKTHTTKQSQSKSRRDESWAKISEFGG
jgi:hypothetical protein